jgi:hypothetical protein
MMKRKARSDRNHIVYKITVKSKTYIGVTHVGKSTPNKGLARRWRKHVQRAYAEKHNWKLCVAIRKHGPEAFTVEIVQVVRGKRNAHVVERALIREINPSLNSDKR